MARKAMEMKSVVVTSYTETRDGKYFTVDVEGQESEIEVIWWNTTKALNVVEVFLFDGTPTQLDDQTMREIRRLVEDYPPVLAVIREAMNLPSLEEQAITSANAVYGLHRQVTR